MKIILLFLLISGLFLIVIGVRLIIRLSKLYKMQGDIELAISEGRYGKALELSKGYFKDYRSYLAYYYMARAYEGLQDAENAVKYYDDLITYFDKELRKHFRVEVLIRIGDLYNKNKDYITASGYYVLALKEDPTEIMALFQLAGIYYNSKNYQKAITNLKKVLVLKPDSWQAFSLLGKAYNKTGNYQKAAYAFESALALPVSDIIEKNDISFRLAEVYTDSKCYNEAIKVLKTLLNEKDYAEDSLLKILENMIRINHLEEAINIVAAYSGKLTSKTKDKVFYMLGRAYFDQCSYLQAVDSWFKAYEINPDFADLKELLERYKVLLDNPLLEDYYSGDDEIFNEFIYSRLGLHSTQIVILEKSRHDISRGEDISCSLEKGNFVIFREDNSKCHVFFRRPYEMNVSDLKKMEEALMSGHVANLKCMLYTLFGTSRETKEYGFYKKVMEFSGDQFILAFFKNI